MVLNAAAATATLVGPSSGSGGAFTSRPSASAASASVRTGAVSRRTDHSVSPAATIVIMDKGRQAVGECHGRTGSSSAVTFSHWPSGRRNPTTTLCQSGPPRNWKLAPARWPWHADKIHADVEQPLHRKWHRGRSVTGGSALSSAFSAGPRCSPPAPPGAVPASSARWCDTAQPPARRGCAPAPAAARRCDHRVDGQPGTLDQDQPHQKNERVRAARLRGQKRKITRALPSPPVHSRRRAPF